MNKNNFFIFLLSLLVFQPVWGQETDYESKTNASGKVGLFDRKSGKYVLPPLFDDLGYWSNASKVGYCTYEGKYYMININGELVLSEGLDSDPSISKYFAIVKNREGKEYVVDHAGKRLSPDVESIYSMGMAHRIEDAVFSVRPKNRGIEEFELWGIDFKPISSQRYNWISSVVYFPAFIFRQIQGGEYGMMNLDGAVLIKPEWDDMEEQNVDGHQAEKWLKNKKLSALYTEDELDDVTFLFAYRQMGGKRFCAIFSSSGRQLTPPLESGSIYRIYKRAFKKYLLPYLLEKDRNQAEMEEKINAPFRRYYDKLESTLKSLPQMGSTGISLVDWIQQREQNKRELLVRSQEQSSQRKAAPAQRNRQAASASGRDNRQENTVSLPAYGDLPESFDVCYRNAKGTMEIRLTGSRNSFNGFYTVTAKNLFGTFFSAYSKVEDLGDRFKFGEPVRAGVTGIILSNTYCTVSKDWKQVHFSSSPNEVYNEPIDIRTFDYHANNIDKISREKGLFNYDAKTQQIMNQHRQNIKDIMSDTKDASKSSSQNRTEKQGKKPRYIDKKVYGPRYVDVREWCEQCQEWDYPHVHGRIRVD